MADNATPIHDLSKDPVLAKAVQDFVTLFRMVLAPIMNADIDNLPQHQSTALTAGAMFAGMTVGHMLAVGALDEGAGDRDQAKLVAMQAFDSGVILGLNEARTAMLRMDRSAGRG